MSVRVGVRGRVRRWFYEDADANSSGRHAPLMPRMGPLLTVVAGGGAVVVWIVFVGLARLQGAHIEWWWAESGDLEGRSLFDLSRSTATLVALLGGLFAVVYAYRKQRFEEAAGRRADEENVRERDQALAERYQEAAAQLGHDNAAVRLAGVHAMSRLADDWIDQRQTCVDVLCAYLRMPPLLKGDAGDPQREASEREVRTSVHQTMREHLQRERDRRTSWSSLRFDFSGATLHDFDLSGATFGTRPRFDGVTFSGSCTMNGATLRDGADFANGAWAENFTAHRIRLTGGSLRLFVMTVSGETHWSFAEVSPAAQISVGPVQVDGNFSIGVAENTSEFPAVPVNVNNVAVTPDATARIYCAVIPDVEQVRTAVVVATGWSVQGAAIIDRRLWDAGVVRWKPSAVHGRAVLEQFSLPAALNVNHGWDAPENQDIPVLP